MTMTVRNPIEWGYDQIRIAAHNVGSAGRAVVQAHADAPPLAIRRIGAADIGDALAKGFRDFGVSRADVVFLCLIYPVIGLVLARLAAGYDMLPLLFPLASGFALIGPFAAVGLYEMSRQREQGAEVGWVEALGVVRAPSFPSILLLGLALTAIFAIWLGAAWGIYAVTLGPEPPASPSAFLRDVLTTDMGWVMIIVGIGVGFLFAVLVLTISVVSFPLLLDRDVGVTTAVMTSIRAVAANPGTMAMWGLIVAGGLVVGSIPLFIGLAIVLPVLGHATWHLYRKVVPR
jgi:uncharacterized membrane protein